MRLSKFLYLIIFFLPSFLLAQSTEEITALIENRIHANEIDVTIFELYSSRSKIPNEWQDEINRAVYNAIESTKVFRKISRNNIMKYPGMKAKATHYIAKIEVIEVTVDGKPYRGPISGSISNYTVATNFTLLDLFKGTNVVSELIVFSQKDNGKSNDFIEQLGEYNEEQIKKSINHFFPKTYQIDNIDDITSPALITVKIDKKKLQAGGNPSQLYVYIFKRYLAPDSENPIPLFEKVGELLSTEREKDEKVIFQVEEGRLDIISNYKKGKDLFITTLSLGK